MINKNMKELLIHASLRKQFQTAWVRGSRFSLLHLLLSVKKYCTKNLKIVITANHSEYVALSLRTIVSV